MPRNNELASVNNTLYVQNAAMHATDCGNNGCQKTAALPHVQCRRYVQKHKLQTCHNRTTTTIQNTEAVYNSTKCNDKHA